MDISREDNNLPKILKNKISQDFRYKFKFALILLAFVWVGINSLVYLFENFNLILNDTPFQLMSVVLSIMIIMSLLLSRKLMDNYVNKPIDEVVKANPAFGKLFGIDDQKDLIVPYLLQTEIILFSVQDVREKLLLICKHLLYSSIYIGYVYLVVDLITSSLNSQITPLYYFICLIGLPLIIRNNIFEIQRNIDKKTIFSNSSIIRYLTFNFIVYAVYPSFLLVLISTYSSEIIYYSLSYYLIFLLNSFVSFQLFFGVSNKRIWLLTSLAMISYIPLLLVFQIFPILLFILGFIVMYLIYKIIGGWLSEVSNGEIDPNSRSTSSGILKNEKQDTNISIITYENDVLYKIWCQSIVKTSPSQRSYLISMNNIVNNHYSFQNNLIMMLFAYGTKSEDVQTVLNQVKSHYHNLKLIEGANNFEKNLQLEVILFCLFQVGITSYILLDFNEDIVNVLSNYGKETGEVVEVFIPKFSKVDD